MITVMLQGDVCTRLIGDPTIDHLDGKSRAPLSVILAEGWPEGYAASFGVYQVDVTPSEGQKWTGRFEVIDGQPVAVFEEAPNPNPESVTRRQILTGLAMMGWITEAEALNALTVGATPAAVEAVINGLPEDQQFAARMKWAGFRDALRNDEMVAALAGIEGKTSQEVDEFFRLCAAIE